jgi:arylsulfatase A-like enzyme
LLPLIEGMDFKRTKAMGFWDYPAKGIGTPSAAWMAELLAAQQAGGDLPPHPSSAAAAQLPDPPFSTSQFPGHAAWIDGDWKLHRIEGKSGNVSWQLYNLASDPNEATNLLGDKTSVAERLKPDLQSWLASVARSLNGDDYH